MLHVATAFKLFSRILHRANLRCAFLRSQRNLQLALKGTCAIVSLLQFVFLYFFGQATVTTCMGQDYDQRGLLKSHEAALGSYYLCCDCGGIDYIK